MARSQSSQGCGVRLLGLLQELKAPLHHLLLDHELYDALGDHLVKLGAILCAHLLQDSNLESLSYRAVLLFLEYQDDLLQNLQVHLAGLRVSNVLDALRRAHDD